jgi:aminoglycoside 2'-N-acetyltransferase I
VPPVHLEVVPADALDDAARAEIIHLCESAYGEDFTPLFEELVGSVHVLARNERGVLLSHAEWVTRWLQPAEHPVLRTAYVEAVATAPRAAGARACDGGAPPCMRPAWHGLHVGAWGLVSFRSCLLCSFRVGALDGPIGIRRGDSIDPTPSDEQVMILRLPRTPSTLATTSLLTAEWRLGELW